MFIQNAVQSLSEHSSADMQFICSKCKKDCSSGTGLRIHWITTHQNERGYLVPTLEPSNSDITPTGVVIDGSGKECKEALISLPQSVPTDPGPLADLNSFTIEELWNCKTAPGGRYGLYEASMTFDGYSHDNVKKIWSRLRKGDINVTLSNHKFPGVRGTATPVATFSRILEILPHFPGKRAKQLGTENARLRARAMAGDMDLVEAIESQRANIHPEIREALLSGLHRSAKALAESQQELAAVQTQLQAKELESAVAAAAAIALPTSPLPRAPNPGKELLALTTKLYECKASLIDSEALVVGQKLKIASLELALAASNVALGEQRLEATQKGIQLGLQACTISSTNADLREKQRQLDRHERRNQQQQDSLAQLHATVQQHEESIREQKVLLTHSRELLDEKNTILVQLRAYVQPREQALELYKTAMQSQQKVIVGQEGQLQSLQQGLDHEKQSVCEGKQELLQQRLRIKKRKLMHIYGFKDGELEVPSGLELESLKQWDRRLSLYDTRNKHPLLQPCVFGLMHKIAYYVVFLLKRLPAEQLLEQVRRAVCEILVLSDELVCGVKHGLKSCHTTNHITLYTKLSGYAKGRLAQQLKRAEAAEATNQTEGEGEGEGQGEGEGEGQGQAVQDGRAHGKGRLSIGRKKGRKARIYSTEMPLASVFEYARNFNQYTSRFGYTGTHLEEDILAFHPNVERCSMEIYNGAGM
jgi:hypothetical protein